jgi:hypothetical protein
MEFWFVAVAVFLLVIIAGIAGALMANLLFVLSRLPEDDHEYIDDWSK